MTFLKYISSGEDTYTILFEIPADGQIYKLIDSMANCSNFPYVIQDFYVNVI